uniref:Uncharacterized protein n=1 Tax=Apteryx owenii TaxID=8824 RepID=A0A8B9P6Q3_APTOW
MATYKVTVTTGEVLEAGSSNSISITLVGSQGESSKKWLFAAEFTVRCERDLGPLVLVRLHKWRLFLEDAWFCQDVQVTAPGGRSYRFPCYQWLEDVTTLELREGAGKKPADDVLDILKEHRLGVARGFPRRPPEVTQASPCSPRRWKIFAEGWPRCLDVGSIHELQSDAKFSCERGSNFVGFLLFQHTSWKSLDEMRSIFSKTKVPEYVARHWREDTFFGYQYLNGNNPVVIRKCTELPEKFPVTPAMVADSLGAGTTLAEELQAGRIFIVDYEILEGLPAGTIHGRQQYVAAPLCLLHQDAGGLLRPIAIQLSQRPGPTSPIFLPSDSEWDWLLAKTWVRNADFYVHQILSHLLRTHLFGEVFTIATLRHLASCHPIFKLLIPHFRFTLHINTLARTVLINRGGDSAAPSTGLGEGHLRLVGPGGRPAGGHRVPGGDLTAPVARRSFVTGIVAFYYGDDAAVRGDAELQAWVMDIFTNGFLGRASSGVPSSLRTVAELTKFLTMVIFTCSSQHAAVNNGQYDLGAFMPNAPSSMRHPPPEEKGRAFEQHFLDTVPEVDTTANILVALILLSSRLDDRRLGQYPEERFTEPEPRRLIRDFRRRLEELGDDVEERHRAAELRYRYLDPRETENSISI